MTKPGENASITPLCPRCGYDQSGACAAWQSECPLEGMCPECGLRFEWPDVFHPWRARSRWLFEHKRARSPGIIRATRSWLAALWPPLFWRGVPLTYACGRGVLWWPLVLIASWAIVWCSARTVYEFYYGPPVPPGQGALLAPGVWRATPPETWKVILYRFLDAWGNPWFPVNVARWDPSRINQAMMESWSAPLAVCASALVTGLTFLSLTRSRKLCGVKRSHVVRAMIYRLTPLGGFYLIWMAVTVQDLLPVAYQNNRILRAYWFLPLVLWLAWGVWWWRCAFHIGWKMPDARLATLLLGTVDVLSFVVVYLLLSPYSAGHWLI